MTKLCYARHHPESILLQILSKDLLNPGNLIMNGMNVVKNPVKVLLIDDTQALEN
jgi:hypothetical protein